MRGDIPPLHDTFSWRSAQSVKHRDNVMQVPGKSGTNGNFNYLSYFYLQVKVKG
jgi:hypothetical protein